MLRKLISGLFAVVISVMLNGIIANAQAEHILHTFTSNNDGATPEAGFVADASGNLYSTTVFGGILKDCNDDQYTVGCGTVFEMTPPLEQGQGWKETVLHEFTGFDGEAPSGPLLLDNAGNLYGVTPYAALGVEGFVFELSPPQQQGGEWGFTNISSFTQNEGSLQGPTGALTMDTQGNLFGVARSGGLNCGGVFELSPSHGTWTQTTLYMFGQSQNDGCYPQAGLIADSTGHLYGTTSGGTQANPHGTIFRLTHSSNDGWVVQTIHTFHGGYDGASPVGNLLLSKGAVYGTTEYGGDTGCGAAGCGTVYQISPQGGYKVIYRFVAGTLNGIVPGSGLSSDPLGNLYGTTVAGGDLTQCPGYFGPDGCGTVYKLTPPSTQGGKWTEEMLYSFTGFNGDGALPMANVLWSKKGVLYGTTSQGGNEDCSTFETVGCGTVFSLSK